MEDQGKAEILTMNAAWNRSLEGLCAKNQMTEKESD